MDVNALDPRFDQIEEAAQFFTVFADAVSRRNDSSELDWTFERAWALTVSDATLVIPARPNLSGL
jgi:hypothetical protein